MKLKRNIYTIALILCSSAGVYFVTSSAAQDGTAKAQKQVDLDYQTAAVLYMQRSAEYRALAYQAYNLARWQLDADLDKKNLKKLPKAEQKMPRAVMVDIDETVLDNSPAQAYGIKNHVPFNLKDWYAWSDMRSAKAIPGSVDFLNYATSKGVKVFFISNRDQVQKQSTMDNLKKVGFTDVTNDNVLLREKESSKEGRKLQVEKKYRIVLLVGDNLDDFSKVFEKKSIADRFAEVDKIKDWWGKRFIVIPNVMYGTWESAIYDYGHLTDAQKAEKRAEALELP